MHQTDKANLPEERCNAVGEIVDKIRAAVPGINGHANRAERAIRRYARMQSIRSGLKAADRAEG